MGLDHHGDAVSKRSVGTKPFGFALSDYCELDTLAMVMIYEAWSELVN